MAGIAISSGLGVYWVRRVNWVTFAALATILSIASTVASIQIDSFWPMFVARLFAGLASGTLLALGLACTRIG